MVARAASAKKSAAAAPAPPEKPQDAGGSAAELSRLVGHHLRRFRKEQGLSLRGLSSRSGLSIGFLSQLERGLTSIGLTTLRDLAVTLGHDITEFFDETPFIGSARGDLSGGVINTTQPAQPASNAVTQERYFTLTRASGEHSRRYISGERTYRLLSKRAPGLVLEPMLVEIAPGGVLPEMEVHGGEEFAYVIHGELVYVVEGTAHRLGVGDSLHLKSEIPHTLHNDTNDVTLVVSVVTPRLF
jgi:quercetin dioxygenase-like cupin family protein